MAQIHEDPLGVDLTAQGVFDDPHPVFSRLRNECPVYWNASVKGWVLTRYDDVRRALKDSALSVEKLEPYAEQTRQRGQTDKLSVVLKDWMVFKDPPRHDVLRGAMQRAFLARDVPSLAPRIRTRVSELLADLPAAGEMDVVADFAYPLPATVISDLFGLPREEAPNLKAWSDDLGRFVFNSSDADDKYARAGAAIEAMVARFRDLVRDHRRNPRDDFTTLLLRDGGELTEDEIVHTMTLILFAGHETTTNLIASSVITLAKNPPIQALLRREPGVLDDAVEEFLRYAGPVQTVVRLAREAVEYGDQRIEPGERVFLVLNAANRDPEMFERPDAFDVARGRNRHVAFGPGVHFCLGAPLARLEAKLALEGFLERFEHFELVDSTVSYRPEVVVHGPSALPIRYTSRSPQ